MSTVKKYAALVILLMTFPIAQFIANQLMTEPSSEMYAYIPQESDFVIEVNTRNFANELIYQRIYNEAYFMERVYPTDDDEMEPPEPKFVNNGIDPFSKILIFREQWAEESIWFTVIRHRGEDDIRRFIKERIPEAHVVFDGKYAIFQLNASKQQDEIDKHLEKIRSKAVKRFTERVNLTEVFDPQKEINAYFIPKNTAQNDLLDGYLSFDFLDDRILVDGSFSPVSGYQLAEPIAYALDDQAPLSLRSSMNILNSIYWFNEEKIDNLPDYDQMVFDYYGMECEMIHRNQGYSTPFLTSPLIQLSIDINKKSIWQGFIDTLSVNGNIIIDTANTHHFTTPEGAQFEYLLTDHLFQLRQDTFNLSPAEPSNVYFKLVMHPEEMIDGTSFSIHEEHPPSELEQTMGLIVANSLMEQIRDFSNMERISFQLTAESAAEILAHGEIDMKRKDGNAIVESLTFGSGALIFISGLQ